MLRVISSCKPTWVIGENVEGLINIQEGMVLRQVQDDLEREGFQVQCLVIPASGIGAWHQRNRVWIIGYAEHNGSSATKEQRRNTQTSTGSQKRENSSLQSERTSRPTDNGNVSNANTGFSIGKNKEVQTRGSSIDNGSKNVCNSNEQRTQIQTQGQQSSIKVPGSTEQKSWWQTQSKLCGVPNGVSYELHSDRINRIKALGNSIVPQIAEQIFRSIIDAE